MTNGLSLFANVGIAEAYLKDVGINISVANELLDERAKFYRHLYPECDMVTGDISDSTIYGTVLMKSIAENVDFVIATPPCQGMSIAGHMSPKDERNSLIKYAIDMIVDLKPKFALLENVTQQLTTPIEYNGSEMLIPDYIERRLGEFYNINRDRIILASDYGVCQMRKRAIFLFARKDLEYHWSFPEPDKEKITLEDLFRGMLLLRECGFSQVSVTKKSGDCGIDGTGKLRINGIFSFNVAFQCKRFIGNVSASDIRDFRGSLTTDIEKGVFITTGTFTRAAREEASNVGKQQIDLIDGEEFISKLIEYRLGVKERTIFEIDHEFFEKI